jgi:hypothetical protein
VNVGCRILCLRPDINNDHSHDRNNYGDNGNRDNGANNTAAATTPTADDASAPNSKLDLNLQYINTDDDDDMVE